MKKLSLLSALLCASMFALADEPVNYALASNGSSATASSGEAALAIDGLENTRWESATTDDETWTLDMGQSRTFNIVRILWEGAFAKEFTIKYSDDAENWTLFHDEKDLASAGWQTIYKETPVTGRYVQYHGTKRATGWGQSFYEFQVMQGEAPKENIAKGKTIVASSGGENDPARVLDGNGLSEWQGSPTGATGDDEESRTYDAWFVVDLGAYFDITKVAVTFEGACAQDYHIDFSTDNNEWNLGYNYVGVAGVNGHTDYISELENNKKVRFVRFWCTKAATQYGMKVFEFEVYGDEWVDSDDDQKPEMVSAELVSKTWNSAVIAVAATDNHEVAAFHVVEAAKEIDQKCSPIDGKITVKNLTAATEYNFVITAIDAAGNESDNHLEVAVATDAHLLAPTAKADDPTWPAAQVKAIYSPTYEADCNFQDWGSGTSYQQDEFGKKYVLGDGGYFGVDGFSLNCLNMELLHYDIWIADDATLRIVPICRNAANDGNEPEFGVTVSLKGQQWNSIDLALNEDDFANVTNWSNVYQVKIDNAANLTFWVGNAFFYRAEAIQDNEAPTNLTAEKFSESIFSVVLAVSAEDNMGAVRFVVMDSEQEVATANGNSGETVKIIVANLEPATEYSFTVRAYDDADNASESVSVTAKTLAAPAAAPAPDFTGKEAVAVFCDALENNPAITIGNWSQTTQASVVELALGDKVFYGSNFNYLGWELAPAVDASDMEFVHVDFFSNEVATVQLTPISPAHEGVYQISLTAGQWTGADVPLSAYAAANIAWNNIFQFKFMEATPSGKELFIDNVYFFRSTTAVENTISAAPAAKFIENGTLYILRDGVVYTIQGTIVR